MSTITAPAAARDVTRHLEALTAPLDHVLHELFAAERRRWSAVDDRLGQFVDEIEDFVMGHGKRLRPALVCSGYVVAGGDAADEDLWPVAAAVELLHAFALVHDDVMDGAERRRGRPSYHARVRDDHLIHGWAGEPRRFGEGMAVLGGDLLLVYADRMLGTADPDVRAVWDELRIEVTMGQHLDLLGSAVGERSLARTALIAQYKTARYSVERPLQLGAVLAGADQATIDALRTYGRQLGLAFQYRDDLLGVFGDPDVTGKPVGDDLREGKPTLLLALASDHASNDQHRLLDRIGRPDLSPSEINEIQSILIECGAVDLLELAIGQLRDDAIGALTDAAIPNRDLDLLVALADLLTIRSC